MKTNISVFFIAILVAGLTALPVQAKKSLKYDGEYTKKIVLFEEGTDWKTIRNIGKQWRSDLGIKTIMNLPFINGLVVATPDIVTPGDLAETTSLITSIESDEVFFEPEAPNAQRNSFIKPFSTDDETLYPWSTLKFFGQYDNDASLMGFIDKSRVSKAVKKAFRKLKKNRVRIAFFDTGIHSKHVHMENLINDGIDIINKIETTLGQTLAVRGPVVDDNGHGSHVAGIVATALDPKFKWGRKANDYVELFPVKILDENAMGEVSNIVLGLQWALNNDIDIVNMSVGFRKDSPALQRAIRVAHRSNLIMVASVGNHSNWDDPEGLPGLSGDGGSGDGGSGDGGSGDGGSGDGGSGDGGSGDGGSGDGGSGDGGSGDGGSGDGGSGDGGSGDGGSGDGGSGDGGSGDGGSGDGGSGDGGSGDGGSGDGGSDNILPWYSVMYPARYQEVIAVGASDSYGRLAPFSNSGKEMDLMAPGVDIISTDITNGNKKQGIGYCNGTSMSTPYVTAAAALIKALAPDLDNEEVRNILIEYADYSGNGIHGELDLSDITKEKLEWIIESNPTITQRNDLKKQYRKLIVKKLYNSGEELWQ